jgi:hypothetical protein
MTLFKVLVPVLIFCSMESFSQESYYNIPKAPETYSAQNMVVRMIDGLGFRYYWATSGLKETDLAYHPNNDARTSRETLEHIDGLVSVILNTVSGKDVAIKQNYKELSFEGLRANTLKNIASAASILKESKEDLKDLNLVLGGKKSSYDFWYLINGPLEDAVWHVGQVVSFRRSSGNPLPEGVNVLSGQKKD